MSEMLVLNFHGKNQPGLGAQLCDLLARNSIEVLDIEQSVVHVYLQLSVVLKFANKAESETMQGRLFLFAHQHDLHAEVSPMSSHAYESWLASQHQPSYIVTVLGRTLSAVHLAAVSHIAASYGMVIKHTKRLSTQLTLDSTLESEEQRACVEFRIKGLADNPEAMRAEFLALSQEYPIDVAFQADDLQRRYRRLAVFDMDSTLIQCEVMDELAKRAGVGEEVAAVTAAAMRGEIDFNTSFRRRLATLNGLDESVLQEIAETLPITEGTARLISTLKGMGYTVGILSGGFTYFANHLKAQLGIDFVVANELDIVDGKMTGEVKGDIINGDKKVEAFRQKAAELGIGMEQTIAVGDGANDLPMLKIAGLGVAFHAKPLVRENAEHAVSTLGLDALLYLLGLHDLDIYSV